MRTRMSREDAETSRPLLDDLDRGKALGKQRFFSCSWPKLLPFGSQRRDLYVRWSTQCCQAPAGIQTKKLAGG